MDIEKLVEDGAQIFCCDASCASTHDGRPCSAGAHQVRTRAVIALTLKTRADYHEKLAAKAMAGVNPVFATGSQLTFRDDHLLEARDLRAIAAQVEKTNG